MAKQNTKGKSKAASVRRKKKKWFSVLAPSQFNSRKIGETMANEPSELKGRFLRVNLMNLVDDHRKQGVNLKFKIESINDDNGVCKTVGYEVLKSHARRFVRKNTDKMTDSFLVKSKEGTIFRIKPVVVTRNRVSNAVVTHLRKKTQDFITEKVKDLDEASVFDSIIQNKLQKELKQNLIKVCPVGVCDIRNLQIQG